MCSDETSPTSLGLCLRKVNIGIRRYMDNSEVKNQLDNVTGTHGYIVGFLQSKDGEDVFQRDVEERFSMRRSTASSILALMEKNGLIVRCSVDYDARLKKIVLTDKAREYIERFEEEGRTMEKVLSDGFSDEEKQLLMSMLTRVNENLKKANRGL